MDINDLYEEFIDQINEIPLTTPRINNYSNVININQQIVNRIYNIRRNLEMNTYSLLQQQQLQHQQQQFNTSIYTQLNEQIRRSSTFSDYIPLVDNIISNLFEIVIDNADGTNYEDVKVTLSEEQFEKFDKTTITDNNLKEFDTCNICIDEYKVEDIVIKLRCKHVFHQDCLKHWLCNEKVTCPACRKDTREMLK